MNKKFLLFFFIIPFLHYYITDGFEPHKTFATIPTNIQKKLSKHEELPDLGGEFTYIGKGRQSYVFANEKTGIVIKIIRYHKYLQPLHLRLLKSFFPSYNFSKNDKKRLVAKELKTKMDFCSYNIAKKELSLQTKILYAKLSPNTTTNGKFIKLKDKSGKPFTLNLDTVFFVIQKKVSPLNQLLHKLIKEKNEEKLRTIITSIFIGIKERQQLGILNTDFIKSLDNRGVDEVNGYNVIEIDVGSFYKSYDLSKNNCYEEAKQHSVAIRNFFQKKYPSMVPFFDKEFTNVFGDPN